MFTLDKLSELKQHKKFILIVTVFGAIIFSIMLIQGSIERKEFRSSYDELISKEKSGIVKLISTNRGGNTIILDKLIDNRICFLNFNVETREEWDIHQFISQGDSVYKAKNSMELIVINRNTKIKTSLKIE